MPNFNNNANDGYGTPFAIYVRWLNGSPTRVLTSDNFSGGELEEGKHKLYMGFGVAKGVNWQVLKEAIVTELNKYPNLPVTMAVNESMRNYNELTPQLLNNPAFSFRIEDCDAPKQPDRMGTDTYPRGHFRINSERMVNKVGVLACFDSNNAYVTGNEPEFRPGNYFALKGSVKLNKRQTGIYINMEMLRYESEGDPIMSSFSDPATEFANLPSNGAPTSPPSNAQHGGPTQHGSQYGTHQQYGQGQQQNQVQQYGQGQQYNQGQQQNADPYIPQAEGYANGQPDNGHI